MTAGIAIVGMACRYPDAACPEELWEDVLAQRRAFRRLPSERLDLRDYLAPDTSVPDSIYAAHAAVLEGYEFDRSRFRVAGSVFRSVDMTHWLALDVADRALCDAGFPGGDGLRQDVTGVVVGNTLTGEFSRAALLRVRWPYVCRVVDAQLRADGYEPERRRTFLRTLEELYKAPFPPVNEETLAGGLSNTIAGRICNQFHFGGGGYTVDGACSSSLLAVARGCSALEAREIDVALVGGVDLSLDPFELVGFSRAGALARGEMRVYDEDSTGFLPGEGCGFVVLRRAEDALSSGQRCYGVIRGWGISSDGGGAITRPEVSGQRMALERAYRCAGYSADSVGLFEGHGTGTPIGDEVELRALNAVRGPEPDRKRRAAIGSIKANIGHTKAAAGIAGLIKATLALHHQFLPPTTGVTKPRAELRAPEATVRVLDRGEHWPTDRPLRAGVNSFGFGGINVHVTIESCASARKGGLSPTERRLLATPQDAELFVLDADDEAGLKLKLDRLRYHAYQLSCAEMADLAAALLERQEGRRVRAAVAASTPEDLAGCTTTLIEGLETGTGSLVDVERGIFLGTGGQVRVALLFPGQASPVRLNGGALSRRFAVVRDVYERAALPDSGDVLSTRLAQPALTTAALAGLRLLESFGVQAAVAIGHSLGELAALCWAGALDDSTLLALAAIRGRVMSDTGGSLGAMASVAAAPPVVRKLIGDSEQVVVACLNGADQTVVSGERDSVARVVSRARAEGCAAHMLPTSSAFHSPLMSSAQRAFEGELRSCRFRRLLRRVVSTVDAGPLDPDVDVRALLTRQLTDPVRFEEALSHLTGEADVGLEVGSGQVLSQLVRRTMDIPVVPLDVGGSSVRGALIAVAAVFALGGQVRLRALFDDRFVRPFDLDRRPLFLANPCELAPQLDGRECEIAETNIPTVSPGPVPMASADSPPMSGSALDCVRSLVAQRTELPAADVRDESRLFRDLHLSSFVVGELIATASRQMGLPPPSAPLDFADATVADAAQALERLRITGLNGSRDLDPTPAGIDRWVRAFAVRDAARPLAPPTFPVSQGGRWQVWSEDDHPLADFARNTASSWPGHGFLVCLSATGIEKQARILLQAAHAAIGMDASDRRFVILQPASMGGSFARTLHLENPEIATCAIQAPLDERALRWAGDEVCRMNGHHEVSYDSAGRRSEPFLELLRLDDADRPSAPLPLNPGDLVVVSGGGKGIAAECARHLALEYGGRLVLLGRSRADADEEVAVNLRRLREDGVRFRYCSVDVTDSVAVRQVLSTAQEAWGPVSALLHGAGINRPALLRDLGEADFDRTLAPKLQGFRNLLDAVDSDQLRLVVSFGSVIGRVGMRGEADYALANSCLSLLCQEFRSSHPRCRCLALESSVWSDIGMAERLGRIDALRHEGITAMSPAEGTALFLELIAREPPQEPVVASGRLGANPPLPLSAAELPLGRFMERPRVYYPGIELVVEADVSIASDPYLREHVFAGAPLLPAVMGLEAMAQLAMALVQETRIPTFEDVRFERPIVVPADSEVTLRLAALVREADRVEVVLRSSETSFQVDHFRCQCRFEAESAGRGAGPSALAAPGQVSIDPRHDLYGRVLFHEGRFRKLAGYRSLTASYSCADIDPGPDKPWFNDYLPDGLVLGDAAARDAALHSIQACIPHAVLLPVGVRRLTASRLPADEPLIACAREHAREGDTYIYDLELRGRDGRMREGWEGLRLRRVMDANHDGWPDALLAPFVEWRLRDLIPGNRVLVALERDNASHSVLRSDRAVQRAVQSSRTVRRRYDGRPQVEGGLEVSAAHANELTLAVASSGTVACDLEAVRTLSAAAWQDLLGSERAALAAEIAAQADQNFDGAATRVWTALECLKKVSAPANVPLVLLSCESDGWVRLGTPGTAVATYVARLRDSPDPLALAVLVGDTRCAITNTATV
jgi:enediyne polyketide synthase